MHLEFLVEDLSGKIALEVILPRLVDVSHTYAVHNYRGIGKIPKNLNAKQDPSKRILLEQLPRLLRGYGQAFSAYPATYKVAVIVVCDLDDRCLKVFRQELLTLLNTCEPQPLTKFCIAVEEMEAWLLGDQSAVRLAYPSAKTEVLKNYVQDSICGTWEVLANAVHHGGAALLKKQAYYVAGAAKCQWAESICPHMDPEINESTSFSYFRGVLEKLTADV